MSKEKVKSLADIELKGCKAAVDLSFEGRMPGIKKGDELRHLFYREETNDYVLAYGPWWILAKEDVIRSKRNKDIKAYYNRCIKNMKEKGWLQKGIMIENKKVLEILKEELK